MKEKDEWDNPSWEDMEKNKDLEAVKAVKQMLTEVMQTATQQETTMKMNLINNIPSQFERKEHECKKNREVWKPAIEECLNKNEKDKKLVLRTNIGGIVIGNSANTDNAMILKIEDEERTSFIYWENITSLEYRKVPLNIYLDDYHGHIKSPEIVRE